MSYNINIGDIVIVLHGSNKRKVGLAISFANDFLTIRIAAKRINVRSCAVKALR